MTDPSFSLSPFHPNTDSQLTLIDERGIIHTSEITISEWKRILPNGTSIIIENQSTCYQCTPLDKDSIIEARFSYKKYGNSINRIITSNKISITPELSHKQPYKSQIYRCTVIVQADKTQMMTSMDGQSLRFLAGAGEIQIPLKQNSVYPDTYPNSFKVNFWQVKNSFLNFFNACLKSKTSYKAIYCSCIFNSKLERDIILSRVADFYLLDSPHHKGQEIRPQKKTKFSKDSNKQHEHINLKESLIKIEDDNSSQVHNTTASTSSNVLQSGGYLNLSEEDNDHLLNRNNNLDLSMDLRDSFAEFQKGPQSHLQMENLMLKEENSNLKKQIQAYQRSKKQIANLKKKYMASVEDINRLEMERRQIITEKVKFQSKYHKQLTDKEQLLRELTKLRAKF